MLFNNNIWVKREMIEVKSIYRFIYFGGRKFRYLLFLEFEKENICGKILIVIVKRVEIEYVIEDVISRGGEIGIKSNNYCFLKNMVRKEK